MKLWRRASGIIKDKNSLLIASVSGRSKYCHPDLEAAVIKATSHDEAFVDYKNSQRVFQWVRTSPLYFVPFMWAISRRMEKTHDWVVAVKGLMLLHGVLCTKIAPAQKVGRLPFDLSNFNATNLSKFPRHWAYNVFVRSYYAFLDQKAVTMSREFQDKLEAQIMSTKEEKEETIMQRLTKLQHWQNSLDLLLQVKPRGRGMNGVIILEAMDCLIIEVFDVYSKICDGVANVLVRIYAAAGKLEASMALDVLHRATRQGDELAGYFELCREIGLLNATECPKVERVPEEDIHELEKIIHGDSSRGGGYETPFGYVSEEESLAMVVSTESDNNSRNNYTEGKKSDRSSLKTVITDIWEVFDEAEEDTRKEGGGVIDLSDLDTNNNSTTVDPFAASLNFPPCLVTPHYYNMVHNIMEVKYNPQCN